MSADSLPILAPMVRKLAARSPLGAEERQALLDLPCQLVNRKPGAYLVREGERFHHCIVLRTGFVHLGKTTSTGRRQILSIYLGGDIVDLQSCVLDNTTYAVQALTNVQAACIPHGALMAAAQAHSGIAMALWRETVVDNSIAREWIFNVGRRTARQRIAHLFCEIALRQEIAGLCAGPVYEMPMTQEQIGDATGLTTVHVNRTVQALRTASLIQTAGRWMTILDWQGLKAEADFRSDYLHPVEVSATKRASPAKRILA